MKANQMSDEERKTYAWLVNETKPVLKRHRRKVIIASIVVSLAVLGAIILRAFSSPSTLGLMSMTRWDGNPKLFAELMKSRFNAMLGIYFIVGGFSIQAAVMLAFGSY